MLTVNCWTTSDIQVIQLLGRFYFKDRMTFLRQVSNLGENPAIIELSNLVYLSLEGLNELLIVYRTYENVYLILPQWDQTESRVAEILDRTGLREIFADRSFHTLEEAFKQISS